MSKILVNEIGSADATNTVTIAAPDKLLAELAVTPGSVLHELWVDSTTGHLMWRQGNSEITPSISTSYQWWLGGSETISIDQTTGNLSLTGIADPYSVPEIDISLVVGGLASPTVVTTSSSTDTRLFITEQAGLIKIYKDGAILGTPFLDLTASVLALTAGYDERGLLGMAFHPNYSSNGEFFVYYSKAKSGAGINHESIVAKFTVSGNPDVSGTTEEIIFQFDQPNNNHNGGCLAFGNDGYLYIATGDGGGQNDPNDLAQDRTNYYGKILRINVDSGSPYSIPADNPYIGHGTYKEEIYAYGFRNPYRMSFDASTGKLWTGDVGQGTYEEIDIVTNNGNYGWSVKEGNSIFDNAQAVTIAAALGIDVNVFLNSLVSPVAEYDHTVGLSVIGGFVYRGSTCVDLKGKYVFGDWAKDWSSSTGVIYYLEEPTPGNYVIKTLKNLTESVVGFGEDNLKELYVITKVGYNHDANTTGKIYKFTGQRIP